MDHRPTDAGVGNENVRQLSRLWDAADPLLAAVVGVCVFALYMLTLAPTIVAGDAGELVTAAAELGVPHPPGYPLWCLLAHAFVWVFDGIAEVAYRVNMLSAVCGALTCSLVYLTIRALGASRLASLSGGLLLGASRELWAQSVIAEVYSLNAALFCGCVLCLVLWDHSRRRRHLLLFALLLGLGLTNHHTVGILGPAAVIWVLLRDWRQIRDWRLIVGSIVLLCLPLFLYLYLPVRATQQPYMNWGHPNTFARMLEHISRTQYKMDYEPQPRTLISAMFQLTLLGRNLLQQFSPAVGILCLAGTPFLLNRRRVARWWAVTTCCLAIACAYELVLNTRFERQEIEANKVFFVPAYCLAVMVIAGVLDLAGSWLLHTLRRRASALLAHAARALCMLLPVVLSLIYNYAANDYSNYWYAEDHARNMLCALEPNAVVFPSGDHNTFPLIYMQRIKGVRPDVTIGDKYGYVEIRDFPMLSAQSDDRFRVPRSLAVEYLLSQTDRPVYLTVKSAVASRHREEQSLYGLMYRIGRQPLIADLQDVWRQYRYRNDMNQVEDLPDYGATNVVADVAFFRGLRLLKADRIDDALAEFSRSAAVSVGIKEVLNNIASALAEHGQLDTAKRYYQQTLLLDDEYACGLWNLMRTRRVIGDHDGVRECLERLHDIDPGDFRISGELGFLWLNHYRERGRAIEYFEESLRLNPDQPQIHEALGDIAATSPPGTPSASPDSQ